jgi:hypothetical protein
VIAGITGANPGCATYNGTFFINVIGCVHNQTYILSPDARLGIEITATKLNLYLGGYGLVIPPTFELDIEGECDLTELTTTSMSLGAGAYLLEGCDLSSATATVEAA